MDHEVHCVWQILWLEELTQLQCSVKEHDFGL